MAFVHAGIDLTLSGAIQGFSEASY